MNCPTTGGAAVAGGALVGAAAMVVEGVVVDVSGNDVVDAVAADVVVGLVVVAVVAEVAAVAGVLIGAGATDPGADPLDDDSTRVVHPAATNPMASTTSVTIDAR